MSGAFSSLIPSKGLIILTQHNRYLPSPLLTHCRKCYQPCVGRRMETALRADCPGRGICRPTVAPFPASCCRIYSCLTVQHNSCYKVQFSRVQFNPVQSSSVSFSPVQFTTAQFSSAQFWNLLVRPCMNYKSTETFSASFSASIDIYFIRI